jgi:hypothetical protein
MPSPRTKSRGRRARTAIVIEITKLASVNAPKKTPNECAGSERHAGRAKSTLKPQYARRAPTTKPRIAPATSFMFVGIQRAPGRLRELLSERIIR